MTTQTRFSAPELVSTQFIDTVLDDWSKYLSCEMECDWRTLDDAAPWLYQEAMSYLCGQVLTNLGVERPTVVSLSLIGGVTYICEALLLWSTAQRMDPNDVLEDCIATRVVEFPFPLQQKFLKNDTTKRETIAHWAVRLSALADDLPKKET